ncbi:MAG: sugar ABC transporter ATP-binding protein [Synergistaceae bacterium]|jgi:simple sugar transport system ATP-binding protein|nr:sugar ABC transporter ATP-binding protein [Synergistaceae bacterium]
MEDMENHCFIELRDISKSFSNLKVLNNVSLTINRGEIHALAGENGSGKSTLIKILSGIYTCDSGRIIIDDVEYAKLQPIQAINHGIQVIYQDFSIFPNLTVKENISMNSMVRSGKKWVSQKQITEIARVAADRIGFEVDLDERVERLSVADKQLIAISRAMLQNARLIVMDEPTTALTKKEVDKLFHVVKKLQTQGVAILFISHKIDEVFEISQRFTILRNGERVITDDVKVLDDEQFTFYMTGRKFHKRRNENRPQDDVVLECRNLTLKNSFYDVSFCLKRGEILCVTGLLGSGRTELAEALFGLRPARQGEIYIEQERVKINSVQQAMKLGIGYVPQDRLTEGLFLNQKIFWNQIVSNIGANISRFGLLQQARLREEADKWISDLDIKSENSELPISTLSGGNQQKVILGRWLAGSPKILILNSPTVGVDIGAKFDIIEILENLAKNGTSILIISDDFQEIVACSQRILVMRVGRIVDSMVTADIDERIISKVVTLSETP